LTYPLDAVPRPGEAIEVAPGVHWIRMPLPFALDHINLWALEDGAGWTLVDSGYALDAVKALWEQVFVSVLRERPVKRIIVTHYHPDHVGLAAWLAQRFGAPVWMTEAEYLTAHAVWSGLAGYERDAVLALFRMHGLDEKYLSLFSVRESAYKRGVPALPGSFLRIIDHDEIEIGGRAWIVVEGHGHSPEHAALHCRELGLFISGDMVLPRISTNVSVWAKEPDGDPLGRYLESLDRYRELPAGTRVLPSHGRVFHGLHRRIQELQAHHAERLDLARAACARPKTAAELMPVLFSRELDPHQVFFAIGEAIAHLNHMMQRGEVERTLGSDGVFRYGATQ
jgi:glyoxylase-like metal-dependent hydrolase (beta-lactamase superfamily II)